MKNGKNGITLVALVITIIILLILAGITINSLIGSGIFENAKLAKERYDDAQKLENEALSEYEVEMDKYNIDGTRSIIDDDVLWEGSIMNVGETATWSKSIENYRYLLIQTKLGNGFKPAYYAIFDTKTIKETGYFSDNYSMENSHAFICIYYDTHKYISFTSSNSLIISYSGGSAVPMTINKIIGVK